mmetsp:Transcript_18728/g.23017  ORF Transcript_18728/g.23017 Transcript_18728/m.23017 type:complete len:218 (-) Transcript_18728:77-730(-)
MDELELVWDGHEKTFQYNNQALNRLIEEIPNVTRDNDRSEYRSQAEEHLRKCSQAVSEMEQQMRKTRGITTQQKNKYRSRIRTFKQQLKSGKDELIRAMQEQRTNQYSSTQKEERRQLLQGSEILDNTDNALIRSKQVIKETEEIAIDTNERLHGQGQQLEQTYNDMNEMNETQDRARRIMIGMARRLTTDRIIQTIIVFIEFGVIGFLIYWKFFYK